MKKIKLMLGLIFLTAFAAHADDIALGEPGYGGSGCPQGTVSATLSPDQKQLSLIFDEYLVEAGGDFRKNVRKNCNIAIPVHVPQGFSISIVDVDYRGYVSLPRGASARLSTEYFFAGRRGPRFNKTFRGYTDEDFDFSNQIGIGALVWSACGADTILRVNSSMLVRSNRSNEEALAIVDSADFDAGIIYQLQWKRCH